jgi:hypothetical protein
MARLDTGWHAHPKILALGWAAMGLHAWSISYCDAALTDGFIPTGAWPSLPGALRLVKALVAAGLWEDVPGGYQLHDYGDYNHSKAETKALRAAAQARKERWLERHRNAVPERVPDAEQTAFGTPRERHIPGPGDVNYLAGGPGKAGRLSPETVPESGSDPGARAREEALPDEVRERLRRPPIGDGQPARPASHSSNGFSRRKRPHAVR